MTAPLTWIGNTEYPAKSSQIKVNQGESSQIKAMIIVFENKAAGRPRRCHPVFGPNPVDGSGDCARVDLRPGTEVSRLLIDARGATTTIGPII
jgi:hypothetical protein